MRRLLLFAAAATLVLASTGCATTMTVSSHAQYGLDLQRYRTYDWAPADALPIGDPRLDGNAFFRDHMEGAVEKGLADRGFVRSSPGTTPDLLIHYHASVSARLEVDRFAGHVQACAPTDCPERVAEFEAGTLVLDIVDSRNSRLIWRGWAQERLQSLLDDPDRMARRINEAVARMLQQLTAGGPVAWRGSATASRVSVTTEE